MTDDLVKACPDCGRTPIHERRSQRPRYGCLRCGAQFDEPIEREARPTGGRSYDPYRTLVDAEPDDIPPKGGPA